MDLFVAAERISDGGTIASERGGIQNDRVKFVFMGIGFGLVLRLFEPVEDVGCLETAAISQSIVFGIAFRLSDRIVTLVNRQDGSIRKLGHVEREPALVGKAIEDFLGIPFLDEIGSELVVDLLIEVEPSLVTGFEIDAKLQAIDLNIRFFCVLRTFLRTQEGVWCF